MLSVNWAWIFVVNLFGSKCCIFVIFDDGI